MNNILTPSRDTAPKRRFTLAVALAATTLMGGLALADTASAEEDDPPPVVQEGVCQPQDAHITPDGKVKSILITAPEGKLITGYCVKAGSIVQGDGPITTTLDNPTASVTISHKSGKDISHYVVFYTDVPKPPDTDVEEITGRTCLPAGSTVATESWKRTVTKYTKVDGKWVGTPTVTTGTRSVALSAAELADPACLVASEPPVVKDPPTAQLPPAAAPAAASEVAALPPVPAASQAAQQVSPAAAPVPTQLPTTGSSSWITFLLALTATGAGFGLLKLSRRPA